MNNFVKMDVAIELLADKISKTTKQFDITNNTIYRDELISSRWKHLLNFKKLAKIRKKM